MESLLQWIAGDKGSEGYDLRLRKFCLFWSWALFIFTLLFIVINIFAKGSIPALGTWFFAFWQTKDTMYYANLLRWDTQHSIGTVCNFRFATGLNLFCIAVLIIVLSMEVNTCNSVSDQEAQDIVNCKNGFADNLFAPQGAAECTLLVKQTDVTGL